MEVSCASLWVLGETSSKTREHCHLSGPVEVATSVTTGIQVQLRGGQSCSPLGAALQKVT